MSYHQHTRKCDGMCDTCDCPESVRLPDDERWSVDDVLLVVSTYGPWGADLNGVHRQEIILADEVERLRAELADAALRSADHLRRAIKAESNLARDSADLRDFLRHVIDMASGEHYWDVVRLNAEALLKRDALAAP